MGLDDIDEDDAGVASVQTQKSSTCPQQGAAQLDDIFGGIGKSVHSPPPQPDPPGGASSVNNSGVGGFEFGSPPVSASAASPHGQQVQPTKKKDSNGLDFLDDVFGGGAAAGGGGNFAGMDQQQPTASLDSMMDFKRPVQTKQHQRSEMDLVNEMMNGGKRPQHNSANNQTLANLSTANSNRAQFNPHLMQLMTYYDVLGVSSTASEDVIHAAYKKKSMEMHPDRVRSRNPGGNSSEQTPEEKEAYKIITTAHEVLMDATKRAEYDGKQRSAASAGNVLNFI